MSVKKVILILVALAAVAAIAFGGMFLYKTITTEINASRVHVDAVRISPELQQVPGSRNVHISAELDMTNNSRHALAPEKLPYFRIGYQSIYATLPDATLESGQTATGTYEFDVVMTTSVVLAFPEGVEVTGVDPNEVWKNIATSANDLLNKPSLETQQQNTNQTPPTGTDRIENTPTHNQSNEQQSRNENQPANNINNNNNNSAPSAENNPTVDANEEQQKARVASWANSLIPQRLGEALGERHLTQMNIVLEREDRNVVAGKITPFDPNSQLKESDFFAVFDAQGQLIELTVDGVDVLNLPA